MRLHISLGCHAIQDQNSFLLISFANTITRGYDPACKIKIEAAPLAVVDELGLYVIDLSFNDIHQIDEVVLPICRVRELHSILDRLYDSSLVWTTEWGRHPTSPLPAPPPSILWGLLKLTKLIAPPPFLTAVVFGRDINKVDNTDAGIAHVIATSLEDSLPGPTRGNKG